MPFRRCRFGDAVSAIDVLAMTVSAMDRFGDETFRQWDVSAMGRFGNGTFRQLDVSAMGRFGNRTFRRWESEVITTKEYLGVDAKP